MIPPGECPKAWWYHVEGARRRGAPAMMPPRRGKGIFAPWTALLACRIGTAIRSRSRLATKQISPCHGLAISEFGPLLLPATIRLIRPLSGNFCQFERHCAPCRRNLHLARRRPDDPAVQAL